MTRGTLARRLPRSLHSALLAALALACGDESTGTPPPPAPAADTEAVPRSAEPAGGGVQLLAGEFSTPESVLYDAEQDVYFVSNINGAPGTADDNGYISRLPAEGGASSGPRIAICGWCASAVRSPPHNRRKCASSGWARAWWCCLRSTGRRSRPCTGVRRCC